MLECNPIARDLDRIDLVLWAYGHQPTGWRDHVGEPVSARLLNTLLATSLSMKSEDVRLAVAGETLDQLRIRLVSHLQSVSRS